MASPNPPKLIEGNPNIATTAQGDELFPVRDSADRRILFSAQQLGLLLGSSLPTVGYVTAIQNGLHVAFPVDLLPTAISNAKTPTRPAGSAVPTGVAGTERLFVRPGVLPGGGVAAGGGSPTPTPTPTLRAVGTGGRNATGIKALTGTFQKVRNRSTTFIRSATTFVEFRFPNWYSEDGSGGGRSLYNTYAAGTTAKTQFDIYSNVAAGGSPPNAAGDKTGYGTVNGAAGNVGVQIGGGTAEPWVTCRLNASDVGLQSFPEGMCICCLIEVDFPTTGASIPLTDSRQDNSSSTPGENYYWGGTSSIGIFGPIGANGGSQKGYAWRPFVVLGDGTKEAVLAGGDSNTAGQGAGKPAGDGQTNAAGMAAKGLWDSGKAYTVFGKSGDRIAYWAALPVEDIRYQVMKWFDRALLNFGTNDLNDTTSTTDTAASTITTNASRDVRGKIRTANPNIRIYQAFILPRVTQVNGFTTLAAQTVQLGFADAHAARPAFDASLTADVGAPGRNLDGTFNVRAAVASPIEPDKWDVDGATVHFNEADGVHTNATGSGKAAAPYAEVANR